MHRLNRHTIAVVLLLIFIQGAGMRVCAHHWLHQSRSGHLAGTTTGDIKIKCDCLQDATMPLQAAGAVQFSFMPTLNFPERITRSISLSSASRLFWSLKGPPSATCMPY